MQLSDRVKVNELSQQFERAVRAMRALDEHTGSVKVTFGAELMVAAAHQVEVPVDDRDYNAIVSLARLAARRRVGDLAEQLRELGVDTNA